MRDQYAGDVSDVLKFAFLRALAGADRALGIAWYYAPGDDGRTDGRHREWREVDAWRHLDEVTFTGLSTLPERSVRALESANIWPVGTLFYSEPVPSRTARGSWSTRLRSTLESADIIFLDPDNGIGLETKKHATLSEIALLRKPGRAVVFISFPGRNKKHRELLWDLHQRLKTETGASSVLTVRTTVSVPGNENRRTSTPRIRWFTIVDPDTVLIERVQLFVDSAGSLPGVLAQVVDPVRIEEDALAEFPVDTMSKPRLTTKELTEGGFSFAGRWTMSDSAILRVDRPLPKEVGVYAFAKDSIVLYVGVATIGIQQRLRQYAKPGISQITNQRLNAIILSELLSSNQIEVYTAVPPDFEWNGLPVHGSAGLELGLIKKYSLPWNMRGSSDDLVRKTRI